MGISTDLGLSMLCRAPSRMALTTAGIGISFFLALTQAGLLVGWIHTTSALIRHTDADVWVMAEQTPAFDYGTAIPRQRVDQVRSVPGVAWAEGLFMAWNVWTRPDGRRVNVELVGLDDSLQGGPWTLAEGDLASIRRPDTVIVDELYLDALGVGGPGDEIELLGRRARVGAVSRGVRTFTASPFVFTSLDNAVAYDQRYDQDEVTYVIARAAPGTSPEALAAAIRRQVPDVEVLDRDAFARRTVRYWMLETGVGITVVVTALLGLGIGAVLAGQALYATVRENLTHFATLSAIGFSGFSLARTVLVQALVLGAGGAMLGTACFLAAGHASRRTPVPLETSGEIHAALVLTFLLCAAVSSLLGIRAVRKADPLSVFAG